MRSMAIILFYIAAMQMFAAVWLIRVTSAGLAIPNKLEHIIYLTPKNLLLTALALFGTVFLDSGLIAHKFLAFIALCGSIGLVAGDVVFPAGEDGKHTNIAWVMRLLGVAGLIAAVLALIDGLPVLNLWALLMGNNVANGLRAGR
jgi:hypothetical protein